MTGLILTVMCLTGVGLWQWLSRRELHPLREGETSQHGIAMFLAMMLLASVAAVASSQAAGGAEALEDARLQDIITIQALTHGLSVLLVLVVAARFGVSRQSIGLRAHSGPSAPALAVAAWLACYPVVILASLVNQRLMPPDSDHLQDYFRRFLSEDGASHDPIVWLGIVVVIPVAEEIIFRGALYGGLRRSLPPWVAMGLSGLLFGSLHDGAAVLPVAALGILLVRS